MLWVLPAGATSAFSSPQRASTLVEALSPGYADGSAEGADDPGPDEAAEVHRRMRR